VDTDCSNVGMAAIILPLLQFLSGPNPPSGGRGTGAGGSMASGPAARHRQMRSLATAALATVETVMRKKGDGEGLKSGGGGGGGDGRRCEVSKHCGCGGDCHEKEGGW
jgi:hypothetical protein